MDKIEIERKQEPGVWMATRTGRKIDPGTIRETDIDIEDIAWSLSNLCRYNGHCDYFYSVAQHSVYASYIAKDSKKGLLHDATECYVGDLVRPIKQRPEMNEYNLLEEVVTKAIVKRFNIEGDMMDQDTKLADNIVLMSEKDQILSNSPDWGWGYDIPRMDFKIHKMSPEEARILFMARFYDLFPNEIDHTDKKVWLKRVDRELVRKDSDVDVYFLRSIEKILSKISQY